jgi:hypothetical protein
MFLLEIKIIFYFQSRFYFCKNLQVRLHEVRPQVENLLFEHYFLQRFGGSVKVFQLIAYLYFLVTLLKFPFAENFDEVRDGVCANFCPEFRVEHLRSCCRVASSSKVGLYPTSAGKYTDPLSFSLLFIYAHRPKGEHSQKLLESTQELVGQFQDTLIRHLLPAVSKLGTKVTKELLLSLVWVCYYVLQNEHVALGGVLVTETSTTKRELTPVIAEVNPADISG